MSVTIPTKDVGEVKVKRHPINHQWQLEDGIAEHIKKDLGVQNE